MRQKFQDFMLAIRSDRKTQVGVGVVAAFLCLAVVMNDTPRRAGGAPIPVNPLQDNSLRQDSYQDLVQALTTEISSTKESQKVIQEELKSLKTEFATNTERTATILRAVIQNQAAQDQGGARGVSANGMPDPVDVGPDGGMAVEQEPDGLEPLVQEVPEVEVPPPPPVQKTALIGAGDSVRVKLLAGVNAPIDGSPYPVLMKLVSDVYGPDGSALPLGEARLIAAAQGSLTDSRALFRLTSMNIRLPNGQRKIIDVDGWVVGEDGIRGMQGVLLDPMGKTIAAAAFAGGLAGLGEGISGSQLETTRNGDSTTQFIAGNTAEYSAGKMFSSAAGEYRDIIRNRVDQLVPQVQVMSGREATVVFAKSVRIPGLFEALTEQDDNAMAGLD